MGDQMVILQAKRHRYSLNRGAVPAIFWLLLLGLLLFYSRYQSQPLNLLYSSQSLLNSTEIRLIF